MENRIGVPSVGGRRLALVVLLALGTATDACHRWTTVRVKIETGDPAERQPVAGAKVRLLALLASPCDDPEFDNPRYAGVPSDPDGVASFTQSYCARMEAVIYKPGYRVTQLPVDSCTVPSQGTLEVKVLLHPEEEPGVTDPACEIVARFFTALQARDWPQARSLLQQGSDIDVGEHSHPGTTFVRRHAKFQGIRCALQRQDGEATEVKTTVLFDDGCRVDYTSRLKRAQDGYRISTFARE